MARYTSIIILLFFLLISTTLFCFSRRAVEPLYRDSLSQSQSQSPPPTFLSKSDHSLATPISSKSEDTHGLEPIPISQEHNNTSTQTPPNSEASTQIPILSKSDLSLSTKSPIPEDTHGLEPIPILPQHNNTSTQTPQKSDLDLYHNVTVPISSATPKTENSRPVWSESCDLFKGSWVKDDEEEKRHPIYKAGSCPYVDEAFDCQTNGRPDSHYLHWTWKPHGCHLPRLNPADFLKRLKGKRLMLVGDSMNRNQFESLLCVLREGLTNKSRMYEIHGYKITKGRGYYVFKFEDYNCTVEFVRSHFLVREGVRINPQGSSSPTLSIDRIDKTSNRWKGADILIFNTGHWWTHGKTARGKNYYKEGDRIYPKFDAVEAYRRALKTWAKWIDENMSREKLIIYRGYSTAHYRGGDWDSGGSCNKETEPVLKGAILGNYPLKMKIVEEVIKEMKVPVVLLNVTHSTNFRKDGHPSVYGKVGRKAKQDCSHWCLPGVPDAWNELIYATLVSQQ